MKNKKIKLKLCLCEGRHSIPQATDGAIFPTEINPLEVKRLERLAFQSIWDKCLEMGILEYASSVYPELDGTEREDSLCIPRGLCLDLYVTGLTVALVAVLNVCREEGVKATLYHFNRENGEYYVQEVK